jgi:hypothetical protein
VRRGEQEDEADRRRDVGSRRTRLAVGVLREVGAAARLQRRQRRVARPEQKGDAPQLSAVLEPRGGELQPWRPAAPHGDGVERLAVPAEEEPPRRLLHCTRHRAPHGAATAPQIHTAARAPAPTARTP